jgi:trans-aconitate methyltransferase
VTLHDPEVVEAEYSTLQRELEANVVAIDVSARMVDLARGRGVDARVGDVQQRWSPVIFVAAK